MKNLRWLPYLFVVALGCGSERPEQPSRSISAAASEVPSGAARTSAAPLASGAVGACVGLGLHECARTRGCLLDQPTYQKPLCRPVENACEGAVRHADLIGTDADPAVTPAMVKAAQEACAATPGCLSTAGNCACACYLLGDCDCSCGGSYLPRCALQLEAAVYEGRPPAEGVAGPIGAIGDALVGVRRAPSGKRFVVSPVPPVDALIGKPRHVIEGTLGTPMPCRDALTAPCKNDKQAFYSLYKLDKGAKGGGPELLLTYDDKKVCSDAQITHTR